MTSQSTVELKECPFCGGTEICFEYSSPRNQHHYCGRCGVATPGSRSQEQSASIWNRRVPAQVAAGLTDEEIQKFWFDACQDTPQNPTCERHLRFARAIEAKVQTVAPVAEQQWQPIETAPKDEFVWLYEEGRGVWIGRFDYVGDGCLWGNSYGSVYLRKDQWLGDNEIDDDYKPTRWMPLPAPPSDSLGGEG